MEIRIVIFLFLVFVTVSSNTLLVWFAYKAFARFTLKVTRTVSEFRDNSERKAWIESLQAASEKAVTVTEATKQSMAESEPAIRRAHENYTRTLARVDSKLEEVAEEISAAADKLRDVVAKPAFSATAFAAGLSNVVDSLLREG